MQVQVPRVTALALVALALVLPTHTPGAYSYRVKQATIHTTVCVRGYTRTIRPPIAYTDSLKRRQVLAWYGRTDYRSFEEDHFIPLSLGGAPRSARNLWPEPWPQARRTDTVEYRLYRKLCADQLTLRQARKQIAAWKRAQG